MAESLLPLPLSTFRDPAGSVSLQPDAAYRTVHAPFDAPMRRFLALPLAKKLVADGRLIASEIVSGPGEELVLRHPRVAFQSYPWEWSPSMWLAAAELTLTLQMELVEQGWQLKDATPLNVLFQGGRPVLVDVGSIELREPLQAVWLAYGQFVRTFLLPMLAHARLGWPLQTSLTRRDGYEPEDIFGALGWTARLRQPAFSTVTVPSLLAKNQRVKSGEAAQPRAMRDPEVAKHVLLKSLKGLRAKMRSVTPAQHTSTWSDYAETAHHYSAEDHTRKRSFVTEALAAAQPARVLDVGCNTGVYSMLAAEAGASVVSIDTDPQAVDRLWMKTKTAAAQSTGSILPLTLDLAYPSPATGWENRECASFLDRARGSFDTVLMLAVIHHLLLAAQIPLDRIAALVAELTTKNLIVEWVPGADIKFRELLRGRDALYAHLTEDAFRTAFAPYFTIERELRLDNGRTLFHLKRVG